MANFETGTIYLYGKDALEFANNMYRPSPEYIRDRAECNRLLDSIVLLEDETGCTVQTDLELGFLRDNREYSAEIETSIVLDDDYYNVGLYEKSICMTFKSLSPIVSYNDAVDLVLAA